MSVYVSVSLCDCVVSVVGLCECVFPLPTNTCSRGGGNQAQKSVKTVCLRPGGKNKCQVRRRGSVELRGHDPAN